jgi:ADP-ribosylglycohydrolase
MKGNGPGIRKDKYLGCLVGGAAGDALGYPVEFMSESEIRNSFGERGITECTPLVGSALISDDTQMTLFTACGLLNSISEAEGAPEFNKILSNIGSCYTDWLLTQALCYPITAEKTNSWLANVPELFSRRAPGGTCLTALNMRIRGAEASIAHPLNSSKGCGGVMRVAPIGLFNPNGALTIEQTDLLAAEAAALTHGHDLGYIPAAGLAHIVRRTAQENASIEEAVTDMIKATEAMFSDKKHVTDHTDLMNEAVKLSYSNTPDIDAIHKLGEGWVAEEALAIAVFCALRYSDDFDKAIVTSVNHKGDSDSTGAITGNILGAHLGLSAIPERFINRLELIDVTKELAEDLLKPDVNSQSYKNKYSIKNYKPKRNEGKKTCT